MGTHVLAIFPRGDCLQDVTSDHQREIDVALGKGELMN